MRRNILKFSSVIHCIFVFIYFLIAAINISIGSSFVKIISFAIVGLLNLLSGLYLWDLSEYHKSAIDNKPFFLITLIVGISAFPALIANLYYILRSKIEGEKIIPDIYLEYKPREIVNPLRLSNKGFKSITILSLVVIILSSFLASLITTSNHNVKVKDFRLTKEMTETYNSKELNGKSYIIENPELSYSVRYYVPKEASVDNKLPVVFVLPGFTRTKQTMEQYAIELTRRGAVVFIMDPGSQGATTFAGYKKDENGNFNILSDGKKEQVSATVNANGLKYLVQYIFNNEDDFDFIDRNRFGAVGHSAGGGNVTDLAESFAGDSYEDSVIKSVFISGYIKLSAANRFKNLNSNAALSYALYDEGYYRYKEDNTNFQTVSSMFVNEVNGSPNNLDDIIRDYGYGSMEDGTYRIVHRSKILHTFEMYDKNSLEHTLDFFNETLDLNNKIPGNDTKWFTKEIFTGLSLLSGFVLIIGLTGLLVNTPFFKDVINPNEKDLTLVTYKNSIDSQKEGFGSRFSFYTISIITATIACLDYIPLAYYSTRLFPDAASNTYTYFFPARMINAVLLWAVVNGTIGLLLYYISLFVGRSKERNLEVHRLSVRVPFNTWIKSLILSFVIFFLYFGVVSLMNLVFKQDFRFMLISAAPLNKRFLATWIMYIPFFFIFYFSNSLKVNASIAQRGWPEWRVLLFSGLANSLGLLFILVVNYALFIQRGQVFYTWMGEGNLEVWLYVNIIFSVAPMMFLLAIMNRILFRITKQVWFGPMVTCMIFIMNTLAASVSYIPL